MSDQPQANRFLKHSKKSLFFIVLTLTLFLDFSLTGVYHLYKYKTIHKYAAKRVMRERSSIFHHTLKANSHHAIEPWGHLIYPLSTNSLGFKDRAIRQVPLQSTQYRILFIGDSFTEGVGYEYDQTFVEKVDEVLKGYEIEVLNAAVATYSPTIYFKKNGVFARTTWFGF